MQNVFEMMAGIAIITIVTYLIGLLLIRRYSRKLSQPIEQLAIEVNQNSTLLNIPDSPAEVKALAINFNGLITRLQEKVAQEQQFTSDVSHELRTPVMAIRGYISLIKRRGKEHPEIIEESLDYLDRESKRLKDLIEDLLMLARQSSELSENEIEKFSLSDLVDDTVKRVQLTLQQHIYTLGAKELSIKSNSFAIQEILTIFLENAGRYSSNDSKIFVKFDEKEIQVIDEGIGIADEEKTKIFHRFYRVDKSRGEQPGTGLGLAIAQQYAIKNKIGLSVKNHHPKGTIFIMRFN